MSGVGIVVIGRNEGERLRACLTSFGAKAYPAVYVDSGSTDGSVDLARSMGCDVVELDLARPFTAARARNEGFLELLQRHPALDWVQFVDGDCELAGDWCERAAAEFGQRPEAAVLSGRLRERAPDRSVYNRLCDLEWDQPLGEAAACGGVAMMRVSAFRQAGGFNPSVIAGEEPELCLRLRRAGGKVFRIEGEMAVHDAAMTRFGQWWKRSLRSGHAYAQATALHGGPPERAGVRENIGIVFWTSVVPVTALSLAWPTRGLTLALFALYPLLGLRITLGRWRRGARFGHACLYAFFCILGKAPQHLGQLRFLWERTRGRGPRIIEYKAPANGVPSGRADDASGGRG